MTHAQILIQHVYQNSILLPLVKTIRIQNFTRLVFNGPVRKLHHRKHLLPMFA